MPIEKIVIAGGGIAAWLSALALARHTTCAIIVLDDGEDFFFLDTETEALAVFIFLFFFI